MPAPISTASTSSARRRPSSTRPSSSASTTRTRTASLPAWYVNLTIADADSADSKSHAFVFDAGSGEKLFENNLKLADSYKYRVWADGTGPKGYAPMDSPDGNGLTPYAPGVFTPTDVEPPFVSSNVILLANVPFSKSATDPWLGAAATHLSGNNVFAYADLVAPDGYTAGTDVDVPPTAPGEFDRTWDPSTPSGGSTNNIQAITTNLFFTMNYMHDLFYDSGFDEVSGNPQASNYGRGGVEGDDIHAESQDYSGLDNANANAHSDGTHPVVQMYLWDLASPSKVTINSPAGIAGDITPVGVNVASGLKNYAITGNLVLYNDTTPTAGGTGHNACISNGAATNAAAIAGNICVVDQNTVAAGSCASTEKAKQCLAAGAKGMLFVQSSDALANILGAADPTLANFGALSVIHTIGAQIETAMGSGTVNATLNRPLPSRDGSVDGTIMSHEWGHIMSNRLIGDGNGLFNQQGGGMGEGWSDFVALQTYIRLTDLSVPSNANWNGIYPMGAYALGGTPDVLYYGIRRYPYSYDMTKDPLTFKHIQEGTALPANPPPAFGQDGTGNSEVHNVGEIWTSALWDCYVGILRDTAHHSYDDAITSMRDYIVASLQDDAARSDDARGARCAPPGDARQHGQAERLHRLRAGLRPPRHGRGRHRPRFVVDQSDGRHREHLRRRQSRIRRGDHQGRRLLLRQRRRARQRRDRHGHRGHEQHRLDDAHGSDGEAQLDRADPQLPGRRHRDLPQRRAVRKHDREGQGQAPRHRRHRQRSAQDRSRRAGHRTDGGAADPDADRERELRLEDCDVGERRLR